MREWRRYLAFTALSVLTAVAVHAACTDRTTTLVSALFALSTIAFANRRHLRPADKVTQS